MITLTDALQKSSVWINSCNEMVDSIEIKSEERIRIAAALFHLSLEHHGSIHLLTVNKHYGSAFALLRPQFEAHIRGLWFQRCATSEQINSFIMNNNPPGVNHLLQELEEIPEFKDGVLSSLKDKVWGSLCGFTHGGYVQVSWRITSNEITVNFNEEQLIGLIATSCALSLQAYVAMAILADSGKLATFVKKTYQETFK